MAHVYHSIDKIMTKIAVPVLAKGIVHPEYDFPNETIWNLVAVLWGMLSIVVGAIFTAVYRR